MVAKVKRHVRRIAKVMCCVGKVKGAEIKVIR